ncbi:MAG: protein kinase [Actinomycetes bacterium]
MEYGGRLFARRYALDVQITSVVGIPMWRAMDQVLRRWVCLYLLPVSDARSETFREAALSISRISDRNVVTVIDVIDGSTLEGMPNVSATENFLGVVVEWVEGQSLDQRLLLSQELIDPSQALALTTSIARTLEQVHGQGLHHARLRAHNIVFGDSQEIRVTGFGVESAILGADNADGEIADIRGLGNLLFCMVTGTWPHGSQDNLPAAGFAGNDLVPSMVTSGISSSIDAIYQQTQNGGLATMRDVISALSVGIVETIDEKSTSLSRLTTHSVTWHGASESKSHRLRATTIAMVCVLIFGWTGWQLLTRNSSTKDVPVAIVLDPLPAITAFPSPSEGPSMATVVAATDYDPFGDQTENPDKTKLAIDGDLTTSWPTVNYQQSNMAGKPGVGLLLDLGTSQEVSSVTITFSAQGNSASIFVGDSPTPDTAAATPFGSVESADTKITISSDKAVSGRYVLVWLTHVPQAANGSWQGGISEVEVGL